MKISEFVIFLTIVLSIYFLVNFYIFIRGYQALAATGVFRTLYVILILFFILAYPTGRFLERSFGRGISDWLIHLGAYYLAVMVFAFFLLLLIDALRMGNVVFHYFPASWEPSHSKIKIIVFGIVAGSGMLLTLVGAWNARTIHLRELVLEVNKPSHSLSELTIVLASDLHLGTMIHNSRLEKMVSMINAQNPDVILLAGDVFDEDITSLIEQNTAAVLTKLDSRYGVYAVPGNHEYFGGIRQAISYLRQAKIPVLRDSVVFIANSFYLAGRDDPTGNRFGRRRKPLSELLSKVDKQFPLILMDHQPFHLEEAEENGVDLQVSGHTHHGQIIPFNFITEKVYERSWGYLKKGGTHYYVSCGVGTWGPPVRLGSRPEIVKIKMYTR